MITEGSTLFEIAREGFYYFVAMQLVIFGAIACVAPGIWFLFWLIGKWFRS